MPGIFPNPSAAAENFKPGDPVKWFVNEMEISPYIGKVTEICPGINKVWVEFPVGGNQQMDPMDLILIPPTAGLSTIEEESGYSSYDKDQSRKNFGDFQSNMDKAVKKTVKKASRKMMASRIIEKFSSNVMSKLSSDICDCIEEGFTNAQTYQKLYGKYASQCSDEIIRSSVEDFFLKLGSKKEYARIVFLQNSQDFDGFRGKKGDEAQDAFFKASEPEMLKYLMQWDMGNSTETSPTPAHGTSDKVYRKGDYIMSYNSGLGYAGLEKIEDVK